MGLAEVFLEHRRGDKVQRYLRVQPKRRLFVIGSSQEADLRIAGDGVTGCHVVLRYEDEKWFICDVSGTESLKVDGKVVTEIELSANANAKIEVAGHQLRLFSKERHSDLFRKELAPAKGAKSEALALHQVVVLRRGRIVETKVLGSSEPYRAAQWDKALSLAAPKTAEWVETQVGARTVRQRLVAAQEIAQADKVGLAEDMKRPLLMALLVFFLLFTALFTASRFVDQKQPNVALDKKSMDIIFNAKAVRQKKAEAQKVVKAAKGRSGGQANAPAKQAANSSPEQSTSPQPSAKTTAALTSLRKSGLGNLIGKIAKRANKQSAMIAAVGVSPDQANSGRAIFSNGTSTVGGGGEASKAGPSYKLGGVATHGRAGGSKNFKDGTALSGGSIGTGNVVALVDDEETSIEGGLDKDAIAEVIKRNIGQIRYCYERQLSSNPELYGKVLVRFTIGAAGDVGEQRVDSTTLKSTMVEGCILRRLASWKFPLPKGGTQVRVSYPFLFKALD